jgi:predicted nucleic acid-binding protein
MSEKKKETQPLQYIILDTCVVQYINDKKISKELILWLEGLISKGFGLAISDISVQELLTNATVRQEEEGFKLLSKFKNYPVESNILLGASQLATLYNLEKTPIQGISIPDKIIASTAILTGALIVTADINDFPRPFFHAAEEKMIIYKHKNKTKMRVLQILKPNMPVINQRFSERPAG